MARPAPRIFTRIVESDRGNAVIHFTYQGRECFIMTTRKKAPVRSKVYSLCREMIGLIHQIKPFKIAPDNIKMASGYSCGGGGKQYPYVEGSEPSNRGACNTNTNTDEEKEETAVYEEPEDEVIIPSSPSDDDAPN